ncbi:MAG TPA: ATPase, T2SS/T4P/T4SS family [Tepidisphaeraceae bacterium]|nr:ATPase, T2SS/T4P/T4SS family [Tepidisphaeraceae bacterium]
MESPKKEVPLLEVKDAAGVRQVPLDGGPLTIGRNFTNLLALEEPMASRFHCVIERVAEGYRLRDLQSRNGTKVNGQVIKAALLASGDVITIGKTELRLLIPSQSKPVRRKSLDAETAASIENGESLAETADEELPDIGEMEESPILPDDVSLWERALRERAESLPNKPFDEDQIVMINARGKTANLPTTRQSGGKGATPPGNEAAIAFRLILLICFRSRATDIHIEPKETEVHVRVRVDGGMVELVHLTKDLGTKVSSLVKVLSEIDIAQRNVVQEGSFSVRVPPARTTLSPRRVDYRISFAPSVYGQKLVMRILDAANAPLRINDLQLPPAILEEVRRTILQDSGMILVCGPTGSGKTTTLYALLRDIDVNDRNVVTIEDPVEIQLEGVTQIPVSDATGNTFSALLKSVLRQDPDVLLVGEIRDQETARTAVQAAMTGHLVFSTVHSRDTVGALYRLLDLGVEPYMVATGLHLLLSQRLIRQLCAHCRRPAQPTAAQLARFAEYGIQNVGTLYKPRGCARCLNTGYLGRRSITERLSLTPQVRELILKNAGVQEIQKALGEENYVRLADAGYRLAAEGITSFEEIERAVS